MYTKACKGKAAMVSRRQPGFVLEATGGYELKVVERLRVPKLPTVRARCARSQQS